MKLPLGWFRIFTILLISALLSGPALGIDPARAVPVTVIVQGESVAAAADAVRARGGRITAEVDIIDSVVAEVPQSHLAALAADSGIVRVFENRGVEASGNGNANVEFSKAIGAAEVWEAGNLGDGVTVAILDSGADTTFNELRRGADRSNRFLAYYDVFSDQVYEPPFLLRSPRDPNGHGTHVAGIIANSSYENRNQVYRGVAPNANLVAVRVLNEEGMGTYADVIQGINWIVQNKDEYGIRVLNISMYSIPVAPYWADPYNRAVMAAWEAGIVVVVSAGNTGPDPMSIGVPANTPYVITVGALADNRTPDDLGDDFIPEFSAAGPTLDAFVKPDIIAPGTNVVSIMRMQSHLSQSYPDRRVGSYYFEMAGTSMSAGVVSGISALILSQNPDLTPDQVKYRLLATARPQFSEATGQAAYSIWQQGAGRVWAPDAVFADISGYANYGMDITADLAGEVHYQGWTTYNPETGMFEILGGGFDSWADNYTTWNGGFDSWADGYDSWAGGSTNWSGGFDSWADGFDSWADGFDSWADGFDSWADGFDSWADGFDSWADACGISLDGFDSWADGFDSWADGFDSWADGFDSWADGFDSWADFVVWSEGFDSWADGFDSWADGFDSWADGLELTAECQEWINGFDSWADGFNLWVGSFTRWSGGFAVWGVGFDSWADGFDSWADGFDSWADACGVSFVDGFDSWADGFDSWADGFDSWADGFDSWADGFDSWADGFDSWADGFDSWADGLELTAECQEWISGFDSWADMFSSWASGFQSWANGMSVWTGAFGVWRGGYMVWADGFDSWADGFDSWADGFDSWADACGISAEDFDSWADGFDSWADGFDSWADGFDSWADGFDSWADYISWVEGFDSWADGFDSWADGFDSWADTLDLSYACMGWVKGFDSWADGFDSWADGFDSWADGFDSWADGFDSWADGFDSWADAAPAWDSAYNVWNGGYTTWAGGFDSWADGFDSWADNVGDPAWAEAFYTLQNVPSETASVGIDLWMLGD